MSCQGVSRCPIQVPQDFLSRCVKEFDELAALFMKDTENRATHKARIRVKVMEGEGEGEDEGTAEG